MTALGRKATLSALLVAGVLAGAPAAAAFKYVEVGQKAPEFTLKSLTGDTVALEEEVGTKALAVVFWALWSPRSKTLLDDLEQLYRLRKDSGFEVLAVNVEHEVISQADRKEMEAVAEGWTFPVLLDEGLTTFYSYGVVAVPTLALLDDSGTLRYVRASYSSSARLDIRQALDSLLGLAQDEDPAVQAARRSYVPPKKATLHYQKAQVLLQRGRERGAIRDLERAADLDPNWIAPRLSLARLYVAQAGKRPQMLERADVALQEVLAIQPAHLQSLALRAQVAGIRRDHETALGLAEQALALEPAYTPALLAKARSMRFLGRFDEARAVLEEARSLDRKNAYLLREEGELAAAEGRWADASTRLRAAVEAALQSAPEGD